MIIDTHVHYWERSTPARPHAADGIIWGDELLAEDLFAEATAAGVDRIVQVTASLMGYDNRYSIEAAKKYPDKVVGVFARFDPLAPDVAGRLKELMAQDRMIGIRLTLHQPPYDRWFRDNMVHDFLKAAQDQKVPVEIFAPFQTEEITKVALAYPGIQFLIDHMTIRIMKEYPDRFFKWREVLRLGELPNIWMKVSYFPEAAVGNESYPFVHSQQRFKQLYEHIGAGKMVWGSNFPPVKRACSYKQSVDFIKDECAFLTPADKAAIFGQNFLNYIKTATGVEWR
jgi:predicted TIM-barrel fold metal-dependent hydrolase